MEYRRDCLIAYREYELAECLWRFGQWLAESKSLVILLKNCSYNEKNLSHSFP